MKLWTLPFMIEQLLDARLVTITCFFEPLLKFRFSVTVYKTMDRCVCTRERATIGHSQPGMG